MMRHERIVSFVCYLCALLPGGIFGLVLSSAAHASITVFTDQGHPLTNVPTGAEVVYVDAVDQVHEQYGQQLGFGLDNISEEQLQQMFDANGNATPYGEEVMDRLQESIQGKISVADPNNPGGRLLTQAGEDYINAVKEAAYNKVRAAALGIDKYPAVVIDDQYVIYGMADVDHALELLQQDITSGNFGKHQLYPDPNSLPKNNEGVPIGEDGLPIDLAADEDGDGIPDYQEKQAITDDGVNGNSKLGNALNENPDLSTPLPPPERELTETERNNEPSKEERQNNLDEKIALAAANEAAKHIPIEEGGLGGVDAEVATITSEKIMTESLNMECMDWRLIGICIWLTCGIHGCTTSESEKVGHFNPDLVVSSYAEMEKNPWTDVQSYSKEMSGLTAAPSMGQLQSPNDNTKPSDMRFKNVDAIGHPGDLSTISGDLMLCRRATQPYVPYYISTLDWMFWRTGVTEMFYPGTWIPGFNEIGQWPVNTWGNTFPRQSFISQQDDRKAAAVTAHRAASIVSEITSPHLKWPATQSPSDGYWPPGKIIENEPLNHKWQRLAPEMSDKCEVFGKSKMIDADGDDMEFDVSENQGYVWALWRPYSCCQRRGSKLIFNSPAPYK